MIDEIHLFFYFTHLFIQNKKIKLLYYPLKRSLGTTYTGTIKISRNNNDLLIINKDEENDLNCY